MRFVPALAVLLGEVEGLSGERERALGPPGHDMSFGEPRQPDRLIGFELHGRRPLNRLLEQGQRLGSAPDVRVCRSQSGGDERPRPRLDSCGSRDRPRSRTATARSKSPLSHAHVPEAGAPEDEAIARVPRLGDPERLLAERQSLVELPLLGQAQGQPDAGEDGGQARPMPYGSCSRSPSSSSSSFGGSRSPAEYWPSEWWA